MIKEFKTFDNYESYVKLLIMYQLKEEAFIFSQSFTRMTT